MITDTELYELEILVIDKYKDFDFGKLIFDRENSLVLIKDKDLKSLIESLFNDRFEKLDDDIVISYDLFKIFQSRYCRENKTSFFIQK